MLTNMLRKVPSPVGGSCGIRRLHLCRGVKPTLTSVLGMT